VVTVDASIHHPASGTVDVLLATRNASLNLSQPCAPVSTPRLVSPTIWSIFVSNADATLPRSSGDSRSRQRDLVEEGVGPGGGSPLPALPVQFEHHPQVGHRGRLSMCSPVGSV
jgi:hypothetical protein